MPTVGTSTTLLAMEKRKLVQVQGRSRITLGSDLLTASEYLVHAEPDGTLILEPARVLTELEAKLLADPEVMEVIAANRADPNRLRARDRSTAPRAK